MKPFTFHRPQTVEEAVELLSQLGETAQPMAGGQSLLLELKERRAQPSAVVSLAGIGDLAGWRYDDTGALVVGATTTYARLHGATGLQGWHREIARVAGDLADRPVRTMGTIGGSLCQADPRFDMPALAVGTNARVVVVGPDGVRTVNAADIFVPAAGSALSRGEVLTEVWFPPTSQWTAVAYEKFRVRQFDQALASVTCAVALGPEGRIASTRLTAGAATAVPAVGESTSAALVGQPAPIDGPTLKDLADAFRDEVLPASGATTSLRRYQRELLPAVARQALTRALQQSGL